MWSFGLLSSLVLVWLLLPAAFSSRFPRPPPEGVSNGQPNMRKVEVCKSHPLIGWATSNAGTPITPQRSALNCRRGSGASLRGFQALTQLRQACPLASEELHLEVSRCKGVNYPPDLSLRWGVEPG